VKKQHYQGDKGDGEAFPENDHDVGPLQLRSSIDNTEIIHTGGRTLPLVYWFGKTLNYFRKVKKHQYGQPFNMKFEPLEKAIERLEKATPPPKGAGVFGASEEGWVRWI